MLRHAAAILLLVLPAACTVGGARSVSEENDRLRRRIMELESQTGTLQGERDELAVKLREIPATDLIAAGEALEALPICTGIVLASESGFEPFDPAKPATGVIVSVRPLDGRGRFVQVAGTLTVEALLMPGSIGSGSGDVVRLAAATLEPLQLREAYRDGFGGARYVVELPLETPLDRSAHPALVLRAQLADALGRRVHQAERILRDGQ